MTYKQRLKLVRSVLPLIGKTFQNKDKRLTLSKSNNRWLFKQLTLLGCFQFYSTNSGNLIGVSQVIAFLTYGWKAYRNGFNAPKELIEVHHKDGNVTNNNPLNLVYLSREDHQVVSDLSYTPFYGKLKTVGYTPFNRQGKPNNNPTHFLINIIQETILAVSSRRSSIKLNISYTEVLLNLPQTLWKHTRNLRVLPSWMSSTIQSILCPNLNLYA